MKRILWIPLIAVVGLGLVALVRAATVSSRQIHTEALAPVEIDGQAAARRLAHALTFRTISFEDPERVASDPFHALHEFLGQRFPGLHRTLERERISDLSLLYTWRGRDPALAPVLLGAHQDVVPVEPGTVESWTHPPFGGVVADGFVWGRGAMDNKGALIAICEAVERLVFEGFRPRRTLYLAFGHDEEIGGLAGAARITDALSQRGVRLAWVLDEGGAIFSGGLPGIERSLALVSIAEKGYATLELSVEVPGGHSSMPPRHTAVGILASAIHRLEGDPLPAGVRGATAQFFAFLAPEMPLHYRVLMANLDLLGGVLDPLLSDHAMFNAWLRTTTAATIFEAGVKENVLPTRARAVVNFRILPGDSSEFVLDHVRRAIDDPRVRVEFRGTPREASGVSDLETGTFEMLQRTIAEVFPEVIAAPSLLIGATDARHYGRLAGDAFGFQPFAYQYSDASRGHGTDERVAVTSLADAIRFYIQLIRNSQEGFERIRPRDGIGM